MEKNKAMLITCFLGFLGVHRFMAKKTGTGILWLLTLGCFGIGTLVDFIHVCQGEFRDKYGNVWGNDDQQEGVGKTAAFLITFFMGAAGTHRFITGKTGTGVLWLLTGGCFGVGWLLDVIQVCRGEFRDVNGFVWGGGAAGQQLAYASNFCPNCGKEVLSGAKFCAGCGGSMASVGTRTGTRGNNALIPIFCVLGVCVLAVGYFVYGQVQGLIGDGADGNHMVTETTTTENEFGGNSFDIDEELEADEEYEEEYEDASAYYDSDDDSYADSSPYEEEVIYTGYVLPQSDSKYLSEMDLYGFTAEECRIARNEIYARHGRMFNDEDLQAYFNLFDWYMPLIEPDDFQESSLNEYEIANRDLIVQYEEEQGYR